MLARTRSGRQLRRGARHGRDRGDAPDDEDIFIFGACVGEALEESGKRVRDEKSADLFH